MLRLVAVIYARVYSHHGPMPYRHNSHAYTKRHYPIGSAFTPVPQFFVRVPRFFPAFVLLRRSPSWSPSPTVQVRFVRGTWPSPDVVEKRCETCGCGCSCRTSSFPCAVAFLSCCVYQATVSPYPWVDVVGKGERKMEMKTDVHAAPRGACSAL